MADEARRIALITGGSRGLGRNMAENLAQRGVDVIITYQSNAAAAAEVVERIRKTGARAAALELDVGNVSSHAAFARALQAELETTFQRPRFDFLINNAGTGAHAALLQTTEAQFDALLSVHVKGVLFLTQALAPLLADGGRILNVSTGLTRIILPGFGAYAAMKAAVETMSVYLAKELGERRIRVNVLAPGAIETDFGGGAVRDNADLNKAIASETALGRVGLPDDIGPAVAMLLSPEAAWINAQRIEVSGGQHISG
jgi:NAD(P)-dependent dehydrogenase (short-subunit alcohol dehydrogenase family)